MTEDARLRALRALREATRIAPDDVPLRLMLAAALLDAGLPDEAVDEYRACLRARPADRDVILGLASAYRAAGKPDAALAPCSPSTSCSPG